jgi:hypothetical protein
MAQIVQLKRSALSGKVPGTGSLNLGELAINTYDGKIYLRRSGSTDTVQEVITTNVVNTGSIFLTGAITASIAATNGVVSGSSQIITILSSLNSVSSSLISKTGSYATTGSNIFSGSQIITGSVGMTGDLTVLGAVNARQFNISVISSSVIYQSGSTKFGDTIDDTHQFTGSIDISGSVTATSFIGDGSGLTNITTTFNGQTTLINEVDGNVLLNNSITDLFLQLGTNNYLDFDFNN